MKFLGGSRSIILFGLIFLSYASSVGGGHFVASLIVQGLPFFCFTEFYIFYLVETHGYIFLILHFVVYSVRKLDIVSYI